MLDFVQNKLNRTFDSDPNKQRKRQIAKDPDAGLREFIVAAKN